MLKSVCVLLIVSTCVSARDKSSILSRLFKKNTRNATPLILVLDRNIFQPLTGYNKNGYTGYETSDENEVSMQQVLQQLSQLQRVYPKNRATSHHHHRAIEHDVHHQRDRNNQDYHQDNRLANRQGDRHDRDDRSRSQDRLDQTENAKIKSVLRSPIYKSLMSLRNSLRCGARDECQNQCGDNFKGKKKTKCEHQCETKFECDEPEEEEECDDCTVSEDDCNGTEECQGSTKGPIDKPKKNGCTRC